MATFVIVHGAWGGGWSWNRIVAPRLRGAGHEVHIATLTGLGERSHLASPEVDLHEAVSLLKRGCSVPLALQILL